MFDVASSLINAMTQSRTGLGAAASATSRAQTPYGSTRTDSFMADAARQAIFQETLLSAVHARLAEIKNVTRNG